MPILTLDLHPVEFCHVHSNPVATKAKSPAEDSIRSRERGYLIVHMGFGFGEQLFQIQKKIGIRQDQKCKRPGTKSSGIVDIDVPARRGAHQEGELDLGDPIDTSLALLGIVESCCEHQTFRIDFTL